jgi:hypothetical protein
MNDVDQHPHDVGSTPIFASLCEQFGIQHDLGRQVTTENEPERTVPLYDDVTSHGARPDAGNLRGRPGC